MAWLVWIMLACSTSSVESEPASVESPQKNQYQVASSQRTTGPWSNRLKTAQSPYLKMHGADPVDWYAWGEEAFAEAKRRNVPIFLSVGYYACHWCHVMHRESFKDPNIAAFMNEHFVAVKVDREERPDVDALYMDAVHILNRNQGGWPASIWMTPDGKPFFAGTYFPPETKEGRPGFLELLQRIHGDWKTKPEAMHGFAEKTGKRIIERAKNQGLGVVPDGTAVDAVRRLLGSWSTVHRGWGTRNQFPMTPVLQFMLWHSVMTEDDNAASLVSGQLAAMDEGGIHDHLGGGFHRYTVDPSWTVPHFEKMLYDNGQLLATYAEASVAYRSDRFAQVAEDIAAYLLGQMQDPDGGFYSSQSAESNDGEGSFYVWTRDEVTQVLGEPTAFFDAYPFATKGNFDGSRTVLNRSAGVDPQAGPIHLARKQLLTARNQRDQPPTDKKLVVAWNGLTLGALARTGRLLNKPQFIGAAQRAAARLLTVVDSGEVPRLVATDAPRGVLEDYAFLGNGLLDLYEADGNPKWLIAAEQIATTMLERFRDPKSGLLYQSDKDVALLARRTDMTDDAEPSGFGRALRLVARLRGFGSPNASIDVIRQGLGQSAWLLERAPNNTVSLVMVAERMARRSQEVVIATPSLDHPMLQAFLDVYNETIRPHTVLATVTPNSAKELQNFTAILGKEPGETGPRAYVCFDGMCKLPTEDVDAFRKQLTQ